MINLLFLIWVFYIITGVLWLNHTIKKGLVNEYNVIGSLIVVTLWPIHISYTKLKK